MEQAIVSVTEESISMGSLRVNPDGIIRRASTIATELNKVVKDRRLSMTIQGREYVRVDGWETLGALLGVVAREVSVINLENGDWEAVVELVRVSDGLVIGRGSALLGMDEKDRSGKSTWGSRPRYAQRSMAITRAVGKAFRISFSWIMAMAGYETTPAEEMEPIEGTFQPANHKPQPQAEPEPVTVTMTVEDAEKEVSSKGEPYGTLSTPDLVKRWNGLKDARRDAEKERKFQALSVLIPARNAGRPLVGQPVESQGA